MLEVGREFADEFERVARVVDLIDRPDDLFGVPRNADLVSQVRGSEREPDRGRGEKDVDTRSDLEWVINPTDGANTQSQIYNPFGVSVGTSTGGWTTASLGFQSDFTDPTSADVWMGARWYTPGNATFR